MNRSYRNFRTHLMNVPLENSAAEWRKLSINFEKEFFKSVESHNTTREVYCRIMSTVHALDTFLLKVEWRKEKMKNELNRKGSRINGTLRWHPFFIFLFQSIFKRNTVYWYYWTVSVSDQIRFMGSKRLNSAVQSKSTIFHSHCQALRIKSNQVLCPREWQ